MNMKPFNLEEAQKGKPLVTRDGEEVKLVAYVPEAKTEMRIIILTESGDIRVYYENGNYYSNNEDGYDLFMATQKRTVWVNFYSHPAGIIANVHETEEGANRAIGNAGDSRMGCKAHLVEIDD
jgi:hypothetical protein